MQERNPEALLQPFMTTMAAKGLRFQQALFVPPESSIRKLGSTERHKDLSWQQGLQRTYQTHLTTTPSWVGVQTMLLLLRFSFLCLMLWGPTGGQQTEFCCCCVPTLVHAYAAGFTLHSLHPALLVWMHVFITLCSLYPAMLV